MASGDFEALGVRARLQQQIDALRRQVAADERQLKEQARQIHDIQVYLGRRDALELDANRAQSHVLKYMGSFVAQLNGKSHALDEAIREFNKFLDLPERSSKFLAIWDLSWNILAVALPALRITGALSQMQKDAAIATKAAEIFWKETPKTAKLVAVLPNAGDLATVVDKLNTARKNGEAAMSTQVNDLQKLAAATRGPVRELIQDANKAMELSNTVIDSLYREFENRLLYLSFDVSPRESLFDYAKKMLSVPKFLTDDEIDRLSLKYKWFLVGYYAKQYVQVVTKQSARGKLPPDIQGLNNTQVEQIIDWFGFGSATDMMATPVPTSPVINIGDFFKRWSVPWRTENYVPFGGYG